MADERAHLRGHGPHAPSCSPKVLVIDDEEDFRDVLASLLERLGFEVTTACDGLEGVDLAQRLAPDLIMLDQRMPGLTGTEAAAQVRAAGLAMPIVMVSAADDIRTVAQRVGTTLWLKKPFGLTALEQTLRSAGFAPRIPGPSSTQP